ncbi:hypothetical protein AgCh_036132 [Apium graveolens]
MPPYPYLATDYGTQLSLFTLHMVAAAAHASFMEVTDDLGYLEIFSLKEQNPSFLVAHATLTGPSVVKEIVIATVLGMCAGGLWKMHHWNEQKKTRTFYDLLEKGKIGVVVEE